MSKQHAGLKLGATYAFRTESVNNAWAGCTLALFPSNLQTPCHAWVTEKSPTDKVRMLVLGSR